SARDDDRRDFCAAKRRWAQPAASPAPPRTVRVIWINRTVRIERTARCVRVIRGEPLTSLAKGEVRSVRLGSPSTGTVRPGKPAATAEFRHPAFGACFREQVVFDVLVI